MRKDDNKERNLREAHSLFVEVIEDLNGFGISYETIPLVLKKICDFFSFGCAFVYERDHTKAFNLEEYYLTYENLTLLSDFKLEGLWDAQEIDYMHNTPIVFFTGGGKSPLDKKLAGLFDANTLLLVSIIDKDSGVAGLVGIADRRHEILLSAQEISMARTLLVALSNRVKMRIYHQWLLYTRTSMEAIMDNTGIDIYVNDFDTHEILYANHSMAQPYGGLQNMLGKPCWQALYNDKTGECDYCPKKHIIDDAGNIAGAYTWDYQRPFDGEWFRVISSAFRWVDGRMAHIVSSMNITENKRNEVLIEKMAFIDTLTGIPNRRKLEKDFTEFLQEPDENKTATMMFLDLDGFKLINDALGHVEGDKFLKDVANLLQRDSAENCRVYRYGGDEFILFFTGEEYDIGDIVDKLLAAFSREWEIGGHKIHCGASIGIAKYPKDGGDYNNLLNHADQAMYMAKTSGKGRAVFYK